MLPVDWLRRFEGRWAREQPLRPLTTWRIGGPAELFLEPATPDELSRTVAALWKSGVPFRVLGGGSNLLIADRGVRGAVLSLNGLTRIARDAGGAVVVEGGAHLHSVVTFAAACGLAGLEPLTGIPGRLGGAVFGNAGSRHGDIGSVVRALDLLEPDGTLTRVVPSDGFFRYRASQVGRRIVVRAFLKTGAGEPAELEACRRRLLKERLEEQPGWVGNAGCVFKNPAGASAGRLIDEAGCKGLRVGGISVSHRHANFFENDGTGTEEDVRRLADLVSGRVHRHFGVDLFMEVRQWG